MSVASGKGGTGKTTVAVNMALSLETRVQLLDCDVEEPNAHLFLRPEIREVRPVHVKVPKVDESLCDHCGECSRFCRFHAIAVIREKVMLFPELCHGCGGCQLVCPREAISETSRVVGVVKFGLAKGVDLAYGELNVGESLPTPVIRELKTNIDRQPETIIDAPPGTSCPAIESVYGSDYCILVTEPTPFGLHDLKLMIDVLRQIKIPFGVVLNRAGIGDRKVYDYCEREEIPILLEIPFDRRIAELCSKGMPFIREMGVWRDRLRDLFLGLKEDATE